MDAKINRVTVKQSIKEFRRIGSFIRKDVHETNSGDYMIFITVHHGKIKKTLTNDEVKTILNSWKELDFKINFYDWIFYSTMLSILWNIVEKDPV